MQTADRWALGHRPALDGLRGLFVLAVMIGHTRWEQPLTAGGEAGVGLFFVLSGFLITSLLLEEQQRDGRIRLGAFYLRRFGRLYPALLLLCAAALVGGVEPLWVAIAGLHLSDFAVGHGLILGTLTHTWSLAVEEQFYLLAPLTMILARGHWTRWAAGASAVVAGVWIWRQLYWTDVETSLRLIYNGPTRMDAILVGCILAVVFHVRGPWKPNIWLVVAAAAFILVYGNGLVLTSWSMFTFGLGLLSLAGAVLIAWGAQTKTAWVQSPPLRYVGRISYGLYLWHFPVFHVVNELDLPPNAEIAIGWVGAFAIATLSWYLLERPIQAWVRRRLAVSRSSSKPLAATPPRP